MLKEKAFTAEELLMLDPKHPGVNDLGYRQRRTDFFNLARYHRLNQTALPSIDYTEDEHRIWRHINQQLEAVHKDKASAIYLRGKEALGLNPHQLPQLESLNQELMRNHQVSLAPAEGLVEAREFFAYLANRTMPCTIFLRHGADPEYTPEPDIVHDVLGHLPPLMNEEYAELMQLIGFGVQHADDEQVLAWSRVYWFAIEFGLIIEQDQLKVFGAGLLSSLGEMTFCFSDEVVRKPFDIVEVMRTDFDPTQMQKRLFYIPSFKFLKDEIKKMLSIQRSKISG